MRFDAVLFDLDGTLVDSAPDLAGALNELRVRDGLAELAYAQLRPLAGAGARGMLGAGYGLSPQDAEFARMRDDFIARYRERLLRASTVFDEVPELLERIDRAGHPWGLVTNKALSLADPLLSGLQLRHRATVLVGGDSTPHTKPHPAPLLHAAAGMGCNPARCVYIGDDERDVQAGRAAGMATVVALWGYLGNGRPVADWGADHFADSPGSLLKWLDLA